MPKLIVTTRTGETCEIGAPEGLSVMEALKDADVGDILAICGGMCACATCHVYIDGTYFDRLPEMSEDENDLLDASDFRQPTSRLSCQIRVNSVVEGLALTVAPED